MQVYSGLRVLTARPSDAELAHAPHRLYGHVAPTERYSAGRFLQDAAVAIAECGNEGRVPVFAGGTGLYFKALLEGLSPIPEVPDAVRAQWDERLKADGIERLRAELVRVDPVLGQRLPLLDAQRLVRALAVHEATGRPLSAWQGEPGKPLLHAARTVRVFLDPDRAALYRRIDARFTDMIASGALEEVRGLFAAVADRSLPAMRAHGVPHLGAHLRGEMTLEDAVARGQADTRQYAKRQKTWFRHQMAGWCVLDPDDAKAREGWLAGLS
jgi:tRNA dimethylallyltransferase